MVEQRNPDEMSPEELRAEVTRLRHIVIHQNDNFIDPTSTLKMRKAYEEIDKPTLQEWDGNCSIFMFDLDNLKKVNDTKGHGAGDLAIWIGGRAILEGVGIDLGLLDIDAYGELVINEGQDLENIIGNIRDKCMAYRMGGDEMLVAKMHTSDSIDSIRDQDWTLMQAIRTRFNKHVFANKETFQGTGIDLSAGVANRQEPRLQHKDINVVQEIADQRLYADKSWSKGDGDRRVKGSTRREVHDNMFNNFNSYFGPENRAPRPQDELGDF